MILDMVVQSRLVGIYFAFMRPDVIHLNMWDCDENNWTKNVFISTRERVSFHLNYSLKLGRKINNQNKIVTTVRVSKWKTKLDPMRIEATMERKIDTENYDFCMARSSWGFSNGNMAKRRCHLFAM
jgi:hypothetical protein